MKFDIEMITFDDGDGEIKHGVAVWNGKESLCAPFSQEGDAETCRRMIEFLVSEWGVSERLD